LYNGVAALLASPRATLIDLPRVYYDEEFRERLISRVHDPMVARFWLQEYASYDQRFRAEAAAPILNKAGQIAASRLLRGILGQMSETVRAAVLGNVGTLVVFRVSGADAELLAPEFHPLPAHELAGQSPYRAWLRQTHAGHRPIFLEPPLYPSRDRKARVIAQSRRNFGRAQK
jgi:hypothetical protein